MIKKKKIIDTIGEGQNMSMVTVVMTTYNGDKYVGEQIESILASSCHDVQLYIYDDGSKDNTIPILRYYENQFPNNIHVVCNDVNLGVTINFLKAVCSTTSDYIMLCDQDDVWKPNKIAVTLKRMRHMETQKGKEIPLAVFTDAVVVDQKLNVLQDSFFKSGRLNPKKTDLSHILMENKLIGCTVMINASLRKILQENRMPKDARFHDWWLALIASSFGRIGYLNEGTILYRQHGGNIVGNTGFLIYFHNRISTLRRQKEALLSLQSQAEDFCEIYGHLLPEEKRIIIERFANLHNVNFMKRRIQILHYGYLKTGFIRNVGLMFIV